MGQSYSYSQLLSRRQVFFGNNVYWTSPINWDINGFNPDGRISFEGANLVRLVLRDKEYEVKPGMTLLSALQKINVVPESVIATREGEMILDDEILKDGDEIKLIAVISGG